MSTKEQLKTISTTVLLTGLASIFVSVLGVIWLSIQDPLANMIVNEVPKSVLLLLPLVLLLLLIVAVSFAISFYRALKSPVDKYEFDKASGILRDPKTELFYCTSCMYKKLRSPLKEQDNGWVCLNNDCKTFYPNPDYKKPSFQPVQRRRSNWMSA